jgi:hypothetical protein
LNFSEHRLERGSPLDGKLATWAAHDPVTMATLPRAVVRPDLDHPADQMTGDRHTEGFREFVGVTVELKRINDHGASDKARHSVIL